MTRKLLFVAFLLTLVLTILAARRQLTNAAPNVAPPPQHAPPLDKYAAHLSGTGVMPSWYVIAGGGGKDVELHDVSMVSPDEGWAVGDTGPSRYGVVMHYTNTTWSRVSTSPGNYSIRGVSMMNSKEGWAVGSAPCLGPCGDVSLLLHYTAGAGWQRVTPPAKPGGGSWSGFYGIDIKGSAGWIAAFGGYLLKFDGAGWTPVFIPLAYPLAVSVIDANEAWVVEEWSSQLAHFSGGSWSTVWPSKVPVIRQDIADK